MVKRGTIRWWYEDYLPKRYPVYRRLMREVRATKRKLGRELMKARLKGEFP